MKPWQNGIPLDQLQAMAEPFKQRHKPHVYGAFGLTKERDIAAAMKGGNFAWIMEGDAYVAGCCLRRFKASGIQHDFAQRPLRLSPGTVMIDAMAGERGNLARFLSHAETAAGRFPCWAEIFEEDLEASAAMEEAGWDYVTSKVMAGSEIKGLYTTPGSSWAAFRSPAEDATLCQLPQRISSDDVGVIAAELAAYLANHDAWAQHYSSYNKRKSWTAFALHGYDPADPAFIIKPGEMSKAWKAENEGKYAGQAMPTPAAEHFLKTLALIETHFPATDRIRFMCLAPGDGELTRHADITDREAGVRDGMVARLHIPIHTNDEVWFAAWDKRGIYWREHMARGELWYLDQRKPHTVVNAGREPRVHLVIDVRADERLRAELSNGKN